MKLDSVTKNRQLYVAARNNSEELFRPAAEAGVEAVSAADARRVLHIPLGVI